MTRLFGILTMIFQLNHSTILMILMNWPQPSNTKATAWNICETIFVADSKKANSKAIDVLNRGADSLKFIVPSEDISIQDLLKSINLSSTSIHFELQFLSPEFVTKYRALSEDEISLKNHQGSIHFHTDIIGNLSKTGNWFNNLNDDFSKFGAIVKQTNSFSIDASLYQNAGANMVQQLAYALAHANEYLNYLENNKSLNVIFNIAIGTNYFFEIAKLKALRLLWEALASEYQINSNCHIFASPTKRNKTLYDYNTNLLRTTTECMSAVLGGANTINNLPYDAVFHKSNEFGNRIARNQLLVLKHESYFNKVNNPSDGAYYIESLTNQLAEKALTLFKNIEKKRRLFKTVKKRHHST